MEKIKVSLVRPNYHTHLITPPLGLGYLSAYLKTKGYASKIIDGLNLGYPIEQIVKECRGSGLVGINCLSSYFPEVIQLSKELKGQGFKVAIGGPHASCLPELTLKETQADYVISGEGEVSLLELIKCIEEGKAVENTPGVMTINTALRKRPLIQDLDSLPFADWEQIDPRAYKKAPHGGLIKSFPVAPITSSRGCPFECTFCASPFLWDRSIRFRSPRNVVDEIEYLIKNFRVKEIHFEDDNLTFKRKHIEEICKLILDRKLKINWATPNGIRVDTLDLELLKLMKKSGCYFVAFGIESGNQEILNNINKKTDLATIEMAVRLAKKAGIVTQGFFIFGLPGETEKSIRESINFAKRIPLDKAQFLILDVFPGSLLWEQVGKGRSVDWGYKSYQEATWVPDGIDKDKLNSMPAYAFRSFFLRPRQIYFLLKYFKFNQIPFIIKRVADFNILPFSKSIRR